MLRYGYYNSYFLPYIITAAFNGFFFKKQRPGSYSLLKRYITAGLFLTINPIKKFILIKVLKVLNNK